MELTPYVDALRRELAVAAAAGGEEARALAERLTDPLESAVRLALINVLSDAAAEITTDLAPGSVDLRIRNREPSFVVSAPETEEVAPAATQMAPPVADDDATTARINFRPSESLKARIEDAAAQAGLSVNAWLVRAASAALEPQPPTTARRVATGTNRMTGWVR